MPDVFRPTPIPMRCKLCAAYWDRIGPMPCNHTQAELDNYRTQHNITDEYYSRWAAVE